MMNEPVRHCRTEQQENLFFFEFLNFSKVLQFDVIP